MQARRVGDKERGFEWLKKPYSTREQGLTYIKSDLALDGVRTDPRYFDLLKKLGLEERGLKFYPKPKHTPN
jgi:hypothetical protein